MDKGKVARNYVKSEKEGIKWYQQTLSLTPADFVITNKNRTGKFHYISVRGVLVLIHSLFKTL